MLDVLVVVTTDARRGAEVEGHRLAAELSDGDVHADVVALKSSGDPETLGVPALGPSSLGVATLRALRRRIRSSDVVIAYGSRTLPACALATLGTGTPFVYRSIGDPAAWAHSGWRRRRTRWMLHRAAGVVALWPGGEQAMEATYGVERTCSVPNARSPADFHPAHPSERSTARAAFGLVDGDVAIVCVGALTAEKRLDVAIEAVTSLPPDHVLLVVGDGPERGELEALAAQRLGDRCRFVGLVADVRPVYAAADLVLSTSSTEGMPGVLIEAGMCGLPVVATNVGAVPWLFERGLVGATCGVRDGPDTVARSILEVLRRPTPIDGPSLIGVCDWETVVAEWRGVVWRSARR